MHACCIQLSPLLDGQLFCLATPNQLIAANGCPVLKQQQQQPIEGYTTTNDRVNDEALPTAFTPLSLLLFPANDGSSRTQS